MKRFKILFANIFLVAICCILLSGCTEQIREGEIYKKEFLPESVQVMTIPVIHSDGKNCYTTYVPMTYYYPDRWKIYIRSLEKDREGDYQTAVYFTSQKVYEECKIGDLFSYEENRDFKEEPVEKKKRG